MTRGISFALNGIFQRIASEFFTWLTVTTRTTVAETIRAKADMTFDFPEELTRKVCEDSSVHRAFI